LAFAALEDASDLPDAAGMAGRSRLCRRNSTPLRLISSTRWAALRGFFDLALPLGRIPEDPAQHRWAWQEECAAVIGSQSAVRIARV